VQTKSFLNLLDNYKVDFLAYGSYITGDMQHPFFRYFHPHYFDVTKEEVEKYGNVILGHISL
jgi:lipoate synthase